MPVYGKVAGALRTCGASYNKVGGVLRKAGGVYAQIGGTKRLVYAAIPPIPAVWSFLAVYAAKDATWTAPKNAWYQFYVIGGGGNGGTSGGIINYGGGGAGGGYAVHRAYLPAGSKVTVSASTKTTRCTGPGFAVTANPGGDGSQQNTGGTGGASSGANIQNLTGEDGETGVRPYGGKGYAAGYTRKLKYAIGVSTGGYAGVAAASGVNVLSPAGSVLLGCGGGGSIYRQPGGAGALGGVVIETG